MLRHTPKLNIKKANYSSLSTEIFFSLRESFRPSARFAHKDTKTNLHQRFDDTLLISTTHNGGHPAQGGGQPQIINTTRKHTQGLRPSLSRARSGLSHAACGTHTRSRARSQHSSGRADESRATPIGSHSSNCARATAASKAEPNPSKSDGKMIAAAEHQIAPPCAANCRSPLIERFAIPAGSSRVQRTSSDGDVVVVHNVCIQ